MNKYTRMAIEVPTGIIKTIINKVLRGSAVKLPIKCAIAPSAELTIDRGATVSIGTNYRQRSGSHIRVRKGAKLVVGNNVSINHGCMIVCHKDIEIGNDVQFSPNIMIYDHDHDFRAEGGVKAMKYKSSPIRIGNNVWIGANSVILRGSIIGDGAVIAAGSIVKGEVPGEAVFVQKRIGEIINKVGEVTLHFVYKCGEEGLLYA